MLTAAPAARPPFSPAPQPLHLLPCTAKMVPALTCLLGKTHSESCNNTLSKVSVVVKLPSQLTFGKGNVPTELMPVVRAHLLSLPVIRARLVSFRHHKYTLKICLDHVDVAEPSDESHDSESLLPEFQLVSPQTKAAMSKTSTALSKTSTAVSTSVRVINVSDDSDSDVDNVLPLVSSSLVSSPLVSSALSTPKADLSPLEARHSWYSRGFVTYTMEPSGE